MDVRYKLLGALEVGPGSRPVAIGGPKQRLLLAVLLIHANRVVSMDRLVNEVWPGRLPPSAVANIRTYVSRIRTALRDLNGHGPLGLRHGGYQLTVGPDELDHMVYESLIATAAAARSRADLETELSALERAAALWRGAPLDGVPESPSVATFRVYIEEQQAALTEERARALIDLGRFGEAAAMLRRHVAAQPLRERGHYLLVLALHRSSATAAALAAYRSARDTFVRELGVEPGADLDRLHRAVLSGETPAEAGAGQPERLRITPAQLPADVAVFVGREDQLTELDGRLARAVGAVPLVVVITGMPGAGKTALAVHWAHQVAGQFPDGQLHINLRGYSPDPPLEPADGVARFLRALGVPDEHMPHGLDERAALYRSVLAQRRMLVLLDNAASADQVRPLLPGAGASVVLVTSRGDLAGLVALDGAHQKALGPLTAQDSITLLTRMLGDGRVRVEPDVAAELARLCGHLPLALRIAAADLAGRPDRTLAEAATLLSADRLRHLEVAGDGPAAVRASFDISYEAQSPDVRRLFRLLGLVPGSDFSTVSAASLSDAPIPDTERMLATLVRAHLVHQVASDRFTLHDLLRAYAADQAEREDGLDGDAALTRLYEHYLAAVDSAARLLYPQVLRLAAPHSGRAIAFAQDTDGAGWLDAERDNLVAAVQRSSVHGPRWAAVRIADGLRAYFSMRMNTVDWSTTAEAALAAARKEADEAGQAAAHLSLAWLNLRQSRHAAAMAHGANALECSVRAGWRDGEAATQGLLGSACLVAGELEAAAAHCRSAFERNRELGNLGGQAVQLANLCNIHLQLGNLIEAADYAAQSLDHHRTVGSRTGEAVALVDLARCHHWFGEFQLAESRLTEALATLRETGNRLGETLALQVLAVLRCDTGHAETAREHGLASLKLAREIGHHRLEAGALIGMGEVGLRLSRPRYATHAYQHALRLARDLGERYPEVLALIGLADAHLGQGDGERALAFAVEAQTLARQARYAVLEATALTALARIRRISGDRGGAIRDATQAVEIHGQTGHELGRARALAALNEATRTTLRTAPA